MVSVIIPCYNAQYFIGETIQSLLNQSYQEFEIIVLNDGSKDNSEAEILNFSDSRISYLKKDNTGVSDTRNKGLVLAKGEYVLFLDADDVLDRFFLEKRVEQLRRNPEVLFSCGKVVKINEAGQPMPGFFRGTADEIYRDILLYHPEVITCPSNYLFRKSILDRYQLTFDNSLSSTADRFFLIELAAYGNGAYVAEGGELYYRVSQSSMSHRITIPLVDDNEVFYKALVQKKKNIPEALFREFAFKINYILGAAYLSLKIYDKGLRYFVNSFFCNPKDFTNNLLRKVI
ncbi:hypothetical protein AAE02nite_08750 [Adhaeribacter aerolatus]|uniref:Glycosyltransferase 2-like domain-containing protein n=1 Tax=Adhaeribacter aerolatus TaxID=670289 RepID=A0A512AU18_9BACT|nr:glycosyltransferase family A protein [Adhaeribacter aerolatus]GEO03211.1 hypothetical protein AAE02nite_08750 [Adhaeribacter aerolatus]